MPEINILPDNITDMTNFVDDAGEEESLDSVYEKLTDSAISGDPDITPAVILASSTEYTPEDIITGYLERLTKNVGENSEEVATSIINEFDRELEIRDAEPSEEYKEIREEILED